jgi:hypothetical protein
MFALSYRGYRSWPRPVFLLQHTPFSAIQKQLATRRPPHPCHQYFSYLGGRLATHLGFQLHDIHRRQNSLANSVARTRHRIPSVSSLPVLLSTSVMAQQTSGFGREDPGCRHDLSKASSSWLYSALHRVKEASGTGKRANRVERKIGIRILLSWFHRQTFEFH